VTIASAVVSTTAVDHDPLADVPSGIAVNASESEGMMPHGDVIAAAVYDDVIIVV